MEYDLAVKKLALFIKYSERGFVLLTVNEWEILKSLHDVISEWLHPAFYNMEKTEYRSVLDDLSAASPRENNSVVFENFNLPMERLNDLLERFNLGRDVFLNKTRYCIFIVPLYVELYIQEYFPNLYAYNSYSRSLDFIVKEFNDNEKNESDFLNIKVRIYSKLALCEFKQGNVENVIKYLEITKFHLERMDEDEKKELFPVYYNYLLMYLDINPDRTQEAEHLLKMLEAFGNNDMQRAMFLTIKAWYLGIINGNLREAARAADEALRIKRHSYIENDFRIAESHYINAMIRLFQGNYQQAEYCCMKSINILKNFKLHTYQKEKSRDLLEKITSLDSDDLHNKP